MISESEFDLFFGVLGGVGIGSGLSHFVGHEILISAAVPAMLIMTYAKDQIVIAESDCR